MTDDQTDGNELNRGSHLARDRFHPRHNVAARCQPRPAAWETAPRKCVEPQRGRPETAVGIVAAPVWFPGSHDDRSNPFSFVVRAAPSGLPCLDYGLSQAVGLGWHGDAPLGLKRPGRRNGIDKNMLARTPSVIFLSTIFLSPSRPSVSRFLCDLCGKASFLLQVVWTLPKGDWKQGGQKLGQETVVTGQEKWTP
jgi:hypothetical protein